MDPSLFALAVAPGIAIAVYVYFRDRYEKEPLRLLVLTYVAGFLAVIPAAVIEYLHSAPLTGTFRLWDLAVRNFLVVGLTEEGAKFLVLMLTTFRNAEFNEPFDGIVYAGMISMGFATAENVLYVLNGGWVTAVARMFTAVPAHASFSILMGYFVGLAKFGKGNGRYLAVGLAAAVVLHGLYDLFLSLNDPWLIFGGAFASLAASVFFSFRAMSLLNEHSPFRYSAVVRRSGRKE